MLHKHMTIETTKQIEEILLISLYKTYIAFVALTVVDFFYWIKKPDDGNITFVSHNYLNYNYLMQVVWIDSHVIWVGGQKQISILQEHTLIWIKISSII